MGKWTALIKKSGLTKHPDVVEAYMGTADA